MQMAIVEFCRHIPELRSIYHIPNEHVRVQSMNPGAYAAKQKALGVIFGMPDLCLPIPNELYKTSALYIELKAPGNYPTAQQLAVHNDLRDCGNSVITCYSFEDAVGILCRYAGIKNPLNRGNP